MSVMRTQKFPAYCKPRGSTSSARAQMPQTTNLFWRLRKSFMPGSSGAIRHPFAEQARWPQGEDADQHDESEDVRVVAAQHAARERTDVARADRLDEPEQHAAE